jgi:hypothetical protein
VAHDPRRTGPGARVASGEPARGAILDGMASREGEPDDAAGQVGQVAGARTIQRSSTNVSPKSQSNTAGAMTEAQDQSPSRASACS